MRLKPIAVDALAVSLLKENEPAFIPAKDRDRRPKFGSLRIVKSLDVFRVMNVFSPARCLLLPARVGAALIPNVLVKP